MSTPYGAQIISAMLAGGCIGLLAYKKPRLAAKLLASGALLTASSLTLMAVAVNRLQIFAGAQLQDNALRAFAKFDLWPELACTISACAVHMHFHVIPDLPAEWQVAEIHSSVSQSAWSKWLRKSKR